MKQLHRLMSFRLFFVLFIVAAGLFMLLNDQTVFSTATADAVLQVPPLDEPPSRETSNPPPPTQKESSPTQEVSPPTEEPLPPPPRPTPTYTPTPALPPPPPYCSIAPKAADTKTNIRKEPSINADTYPILLEVFYNWIRVLDIDYNSDGDGKDWYQFKFQYGGIENTGWVRGDVVQIAAQKDCERFRNDTFNCPDAYVNTLAAELPIYLQIAYKDDCTKLEELVNPNKFPDPYRHLLKTLPNLENWLEHNGECLKNNNLMQGDFLYLLNYLVSWMLEQGGYEEELEELNDLMQPDKADSCDGVFEWLRRPRVPHTPDPPTPEEPTPTDTPTPTRAPSGTPSPAALPGSGNQDVPTPAPTIPTPLESPTPAPTHTPTPDAPEPGLGVVIVYVSEWANNTNSLYVLRGNARHQQFTNSLDSAMRYSYPTIHPDHNRIAWFGRDVGSEKVKLLLLIANVPPDNSSPSVAIELTHMVELKDGEEPGPIAWSPDGKELLFTVFDDGGPRVYQYTLGDDISHPWPDENHRRGYATYSPDGRFIAFVDYGDKPGLHVLDNVKQGDSVRIEKTQSCSVITSPVFGPKENFGLLFACQDEGKFGLYWYAKEEDEAEPKRLEMDYTALEGRRIDQLLMRPDGELFLYDGVRVYAAKPDYENVTASVPLSRVEVLFKDSNGRPVQVVAIGLNNLTG